MADFDNTNKGVAFKNDYKTEDKHPYYKGKGNFNGQDFEFGIWVKENDKGKFLTFSFSEPYVKKMQEDMYPAKEPTGYDKAKATADSLRHEEAEQSPIDLSDIPF